MTDGVVRRGVVGDQLRDGNGGILSDPGQNRHLVGGLDMWEVVARNAKHELPGGRLAITRHSDEVYAVVLGCDWR